MNLESKEIQELIDTIQYTKFSFSEIVTALKAGEEYRKALLERAPFKRGDVVVLTETPEINDETSWGWMPARHFLIKGAVGRVDEVTYYEESFRAGVLFDDESWIDRDGLRHPVFARSQYWFSEKWLENLTRRRK